MRTFQLRFKFVFVLAVVIFAAMLAVGWSAKRNVNLDDFLKELTVVNVKDNQTQSVIWLPFEFNVRVLGGAKAPKDVSALKPYLIFIVQCFDWRNLRLVVANPGQGPAQRRLVGSRKASGSCACCDCRKTRNRKNGNRRRRLFCRRYAHYRL